MFVYKCTLWLNWLLNCSIETSNQSKQLLHWWPITSSVALVSINSTTALYPRRLVTPCMWGNLFYIFSSWECSVFKSNTLSILHPNIIPHMVLLLQKQNILPRWDAFQLKLVHYLGCSVSNVNILVIERHITWVIFIYHQIVNDWNYFLFSADIINVENTLFHV